MLRYAAISDPAQVRDYLDQFVKKTGADELITVHQAPALAGRLRSVAAGEERCGAGQEAGGAGRQAGRPSTGGGRHGCGHGP